MFKVSSTAAIWCMEVFNKEISHQNNQFGSALSRFAMIPAVKFDQSYLTGLDFKDVSRIIENTIFFIHAVVSDVKN